VLLSFGLLIAMLRHARQRRTVGAARGRGRGAQAVPAVAPHGQARSHWQPGQGQVPLPARPAQAAQPAPVAQPAPLAPVSAPAAAAAPAAGQQAGPEAAGYYQPPYHESPEPELAVDAEDYQDDPTSDEASAGGTGPAGFWLPGGSGAGEPGQLRHPGEPGGADEDGADEDGADGEPEPPGMPFDRKWSPPTPPGT
jgi:hypothetical protein